MEMTLSLKETNNVGTFAAITFCPDQSVCCGVDNTSCCANGRGVWIQDGQVISSRPTVLPSSTHRLSQTSIPPTTSLMTFSPASTHTGLTQGGKIGLGVGLGIGILLILVLGFLMHLYILEKHRRKWLETQLHYQQPGDVSVSVMPRAELPSQV